MVPYHAPRSPLLKISGIAVGGWHHCRHSRSSPSGWEILCFFFSRQRKRKNPQRNAPRGMTLLGPLDSFQTPTIYRNNILTGYGCIQLRSIEFTLCEVAQCTSLVGGAQSIISHHYERYQQSWVGWFPQRSYYLPSFPARFRLSKPPISIV